MESFPKTLQQDLDDCKTSISKATKPVAFPQLTGKHMSLALKSYYHETWKPRNRRSPMKSFVSEILNLNFDPKVPCFVTLDQFQLGPDPIEIIQELETKLFKSRNEVSDLVIQNEDLQENIIELSLEAGNTEVLVGNLNCENRELRSKITALESVLATLKVVSK